MSARIWQGWYSLVRPLITGTRECAAKRSMIACSKVRIHDHVDHPRDHAGDVLDWLAARELGVVAVEVIAMPPSWFIPASNDTRVRVDAFSNTIASVRSRSGW